MESRQLAVRDAIAFTPRVFPDERGLTVSPFQATAFMAATGQVFFRVAQTLHSTSRRSVVRGLHFSTVPPGTVKYVSCPQGSALDIVVDIRLGSPTFKKWDAVLLDQRDFRSVYVPIGVGHAFIALEDNTVMSYLLSGEYVADNELTLSVLDPLLSLPIPEELEPIMSERDRAAPTLAEADAAGILPRYAECEIIEHALSLPSTSTGTSQGA